MEDIIRINEVSVARGEVKQINLNIAKLPTHTLIDLPIYIYRAQEKGPALLLTAGLHGDEINGIETIRRLIYHKKIMPKNGTVIAIPVVNVYGFIHTSRKFPDGKDLNRVFPGSNKGSLASRIAYVLMKEVLPNVDAGVDFHTGGADKMNFPHIRSYLKTGANLSLARAFAPPFIVNSKAPDHSFRKAAALTGKSILTFEGGESLRLHEFSIQEGVDGVLRLMTHLGMKPGGPKQSRLTEILKGSRWRRAQYAGLFRAKVEIGEKVTKNQLLGYITDPFGETEYRIRAKDSGYIIGINNLCVVNKGEALIHIGSVPVPENTTFSSHEKMQEKK